MWVVWQHWIIHACLIALYEGFIGRWCIKGRDACLGCWSSNSKGRVVFTWRTETLNSHRGIWICSLSSVFFIRYFSVAVFHILFPPPPCRSNLFRCSVTLARDTGLNSAPALIRLPPICGPGPVSPSNSVLIPFQLHPYTEQKEN